MTAPAVVVCGVPHPQDPAHVCGRLPDHSDVVTWSGRYTDGHVAFGPDRRQLLHWQPLSSWLPRKVHTEQLVEVSEEDALALVADMPVVAEQPEPAWSSDRSTSLQQMVNALQALGVRTILTLDDAPQAVVVAVTPEAELVLALLDRAGDTAAVTLTLAGVTRLHNALTTWLEGRA